MKDAAWLNTMKRDKMKYSWQKVVLRGGLNRFKTSTNILKLEVQTGGNIKRNCWAKAELSAGQYVTEHNTWRYKKYLVIKMGWLFSPSKSLQEVYYPEHMARTQYVFPFHIQLFCF